MSSINIASSTETITINSVRIISTIVNLGVSAIITVVLMSDTNVVKQQQLLMEGSDYTGWGNDDSYVNAFVLKSLGFTAT